MIGDFNLEFWPIVYLKLNDKEINEVMTDFVKDTKETTLTNIFNHSKNALKDFLKI